MMRAFAVVGLMLVVTACSVDVPPIDDPQNFACVTNGDCADGYYCASNQRCTKNGENPSNNEACKSAPCGSGMACVPNPDQGYTCVNDCRQTGAVCPDNTACIVKDSANTSACVLLCDPDLPNAQNCEIEVNGALREGRCVTTGDTKGNSVRACAPCNPIAAAGGCTAGTICQSRGIENLPYYESLTCGSGQGCSSDTQCTEFPWTKCANGSCANPCDVTNQPCLSSGQGCLPVTTNGNRYQCGACDGSYICGVSNGCVYQDATLIRRCVPSCASSSECITGTDAAVCTTIQGPTGYPLVCAFCAGGCTGSATCQATSTNSYLDGAAACISTNPTCGGTTCNSGDLCAATADGTGTCATPCTNLDAACTGVGGAQGICSKVNSNQNMPVQICVVEPCVAQPCLAPAECHLPLPANGYFQDYSLAKASGKCRCPTDGRGWYSLGTSACGRGAFPLTAVTHSQLVAPQPQGRLLVAYAANTSNIEVYEWDAGTYSWAARHPTGGMGYSQSTVWARQPTLSQVGSHTVLAWTQTDTSGFNQVYASELMSDTSWQSIGDSGYGSGITTYVAAADMPRAPMMLPNTADTFRAVWRNDQPDQLESLNYNANMWMAAPNRAVPPNGDACVNPRGLYFNGKAYLAAMCNSGLMVRTDDGAIWGTTVPVAGSSYAIRTPHFDMAQQLNPSQIVVAYSAGNTALQARVHVQTLSGAVWQDLVTGALGSFQTYGVAIAIDTASNPVVVWAEEQSQTTNLVREIHAARFDGTQFRGIAADQSTLVSATTTADSNEPKLGVIYPSPSGVAAAAACISWVETIGGGSTYVLVKCHDLN